MPARSKVQANLDPKLFISEILCYIPTYRGGHNLSNRLLDEPVQSSQNLGWLINKEALKQSKFRE